MINEEQIRKMIIPALDVQDKESLDNLLHELRGSAKMVKVGMELFYTYGFDVLSRIQRTELDIFLDLKMHDIPNTVHKACKTLSKRGVNMLNVHASGGIEMMNAAAEGMKEFNENSLLIAVTQLTSTSQRVMNDDLLIPGSISDIVLKYAENAKKAGLDGIVCSAQEVEIIKKEIGEDFKCITPGIRPKGANSDDQSRIMTPLEAITAGSDFLVIGRPITQADSPKEAFEKIYEDIKNG